MSEDPDQLRQSIADTRERMGAEIDALAYKLDVPERTKDMARDATRKVRAKALGSGEGMIGSLRENPAALALGAAAIGLLAGALIPNTEAEDRRVGPMADAVRDQAAAAGREAMERGKRVAGQAAGAAKEAASDATDRQRQGMMRNTRRRLEAVTED